MIKINWNAINKIIKIEKVRKNMNCRKCGYKINKLKHRYMILYPAEKFYRIDKKYYYYHIDCFIKIIKKGDYLVSHITEITSENRFSCDICRQEIRKGEGVILGVINTGYSFHKACLIAGIYRKMKMKLPKEILDEIITINV